MDDDIIPAAPPAEVEPEAEPELEPVPAAPRKVITAEKALEYAAALKMFAEFHGAPSIIYRTWEVLLAKFRDNAADS